MSQTIIPAECLEKFAAAQSPEDVATMAKTEGIEVTDEQIALIWDELSHAEDISELADNDLKNVAGGVKRHPQDVEVFGSDEATWCKQAYFEPWIPFDPKSAASAGTICCANCQNFTPDSPSDSMGLGACHYRWKDVPW